MEKRMEIGEIRRVSHSAWDYARNWDGTESWTVAAEQLSETGWLPGYAWEIRSPDGETSYWWASDAPDGSEWDGEDWV